MKTRRTYASPGRSEAAAATRQRIIDAASELMLELWYEDITLAAIAKAAGVSHQTVLNHFESKEGVARAAAESFGGDTIAARDEAPVGDVAGAVAVLVGEYERFGDANARWAISAERLGSLAELIDQGRANHQAWIERVFDDLLPAAAPERRRRVNAVHAATDVYTWKLLRRDLRLSRPETERTMVTLVQGALAIEKTKGAP